MLKCKCLLTRAKIADYFRNLCSKNVIKITAKDKLISYFMCRVASGRGQSGLEYYIMYCQDCSRS